MAAKKLVVPATVTIYNAKGKPEQHSRANARDLINGAGYTWEKRGNTNPASNAPFAIPQNTKFAKSKAQEILDRTGGKGPEEDDGEEVFEGVDDGSATGPINLPETDTDEEEVEEAPVVVRKPRKPRAPKPTPAPEAEEIEGIEEQ